jgi:hypothetical protein
MEKSNFAERTAKLRDVATELHKLAGTIPQLSPLADAVMEEVQHMEAAQIRFKQRVEKKTGARATARR